MLEPLWARSLRLALVFSLALASLPADCLAVNQSKSPPARVGLPPAAASLNVPAMVAPVVSARAPDQPGAPVDALKPLDAVAPAANGASGAAPAAVVEASAEEGKVAADRAFENARTYELESSEPGKIGRLFRLIWPAHTLFRVRQSHVAIDGYLPRALPVVEKANPSLLSRLKSGPVIALVRWQLARFHQPQTRTDEELFDALAPHAAGKPNKYNIVIEGGRISVAKLFHGLGWKRVDDLLSKHILLSGYSKDVRFAGEIWKGEDGVIYLSNNSGTYQPSEPELERAVAYLAAVFPNHAFTASPAVVEAPVSTLNVESAPEAPFPRGVTPEVFKKELRRKTIHQKNWGYLGAFLLLGYPHAAYALAGFAAFTGVAEFVVRNWEPARAWARKRFGAVLREREAKQFTGNFWGALGAATAVALYGWNPALVAAAIVAYAFGDAISPLVGMWFGWKPYTVAGTKRSLDGTLAGFTVVFAASLLLGFAPLVALGGALAFTAVDVYPVKPDDNFLIPVVVPTALFLLGLL